MIHPQQRSEMSVSKQFSAACERNRDPILVILQDLFTEPVRVLEIGSGTGQHAVHFGRHLPHVIWQTSDLPGNHPSIVAWQEEAGLPNVLPPLVLDMNAPEWPSERYDAVFSANTCHIMAWPQVERMFAGFPRVLRGQAAHMGIRDSEAMHALAARHGLRQLADHAMPAHNRLLVWQRQ